MGKHRQERPHGLQYPLAWYWRERQNRRWLKQTDRRVRKYTRHERFAAFMVDLKEAFGNE